MKSVRPVSAVLLASVLALSGFVLSGCDDNVEVIRDPDIHFQKGQTWAWRPMNAPEPKPAAQAPATPPNNDNRPVTSRDVINSPAVQPAPGQRLESNRDWNTENNRSRLQEAIEKSLRSKGLTQVSDPATATYLVDYHVAVKTQTATVGTVYGGYPGVSCGPWGCWSNWGYWGGWGWGPPEVEYRTVPYHVGTFVLDIAERSPKKLAYRAISNKQLNNKSSITPYQADQAVGALLKSLKVQ